jgi:hypothetical protein
VTAPDGPRLTSPAATVSRSCHYPPAVMCRRAALDVDAAGRGAGRGQGKTWRPPGRGHGRGHRQARRAGRGRTRTPPPPPGLPRRHGCILFRRSAQNGAISQLLDKAGNANHGVAQTLPAPTLPPWHQTPSRRGAAFPLVDALGVRKGNNKSVSFGWTRTCHPFVTRFSSLTSCFCLVIFKR